MSGLHRVCCCEGGFCPCVDTTTYTYYADCTSVIEWYKADCACIESIATSPGFLYTAQDGTYTCPQLTLIAGTTPTCETCKLSRTGAGFNIPIDAVEVLSGGGCTDYGFSYNAFNGGWTAIVYPPDPSGTCPDNYTDKWKAIVTLPGAVQCVYEAPYTGCSPPKMWTLVSTTGLPSSGCIVNGAWQIVNPITYTIGTFTLSRV